MSPALLWWCHSLTMLTMVVVAGLILEFCKPLWRVLQHNIFLYIAYVLTACAIAAWINDTLIT